MTRCTDFTRMYGYVADLGERGREGHASLNQNTAGKAPARRRAAAEAAAPRCSRPAWAAGYGQGPMEAPPGGLRASAPHHSEVRRCPGTSGAMGTFEANP